VVVSVGATEGSALVFFRTRTAVARAATATASTSPTLTVNSSWRLVPGSRRSRPAVALALVSAPVGAPSTSTGSPVAVVPAGTGTVTCTARSARCPVDEATTRILTRSPLWTVPVARTVASSARHPCWGGAGGSSTSPGGGPFPSAQTGGLASAAPARATLGTSATRSPATTSTTRRHRGVARRPPRRVTVLAIRPQVFVTCRPGRARLGERATPPCPRSFSQPLLGARIMVKKLRRVTSSRARPDRFDPFGLTAPATVSATARGPGSTLRDRWGRGGGWRATWS
jgi:hypothetical protein